VVSGTVFGLGRFAGDDGRAFAGLVVDGRVFDLGEGSSTQALLADWDATLERLAALAADPPGDGVPLERLRPLVPVDPPGQVLCAGANYFRHIEEIVFSMARVWDDDRPEEERRAAATEEARSRADDDPFAFVVPSSALSGANDDIVLAGPGHKHDWELELAVVIGRGGEDIAQEDALQHVAGYTMCNDVSTRDVMQRPKLPMTDFVTSKGRRTFKPIGPVIVPAQFVPDYRALHITLRVNGEVMQDEGVDDIVHGVERLIAYVSSLVTLNPGDVLLTGSPAGNAGHHGDRWLVPGDVMEGEISGLGVMRNRCVAPPGT
jgi:2-keto-4-pentenoate hydratase/2-oxohepta-3-ene-1,7-dioic acid hydratase in catechol pathway